MAGTKGCGGRPGARARARFEGTAFSAGKCDHSNCFSLKAHRSMPRTPTTEDRRLEEGRTHKKYWKRWGPYLSERQWGTVREDYSRDGAAWEHIPHDHARSRANRWGEDGIGGISDRHQDRKSTRLNSSHVAIS